MLSNLALMLSQLPLASMLIKAEVAPMPAKLEQEHAKLEQEQAQLAQMQAKFEQTQAQLEHTQAQLEQVQAKLERRQYLPYGLEKIVKFGHWSPEGERSPKRDLEWYVLCTEKDAQKNCDRALLLSKYALCKRRFDEHSPLWNESEIRRWLNGDFIKRAFNDEEQARLLYVLDGEPYRDDEDYSYNLDVIDTCKDRVFLLSLSECVRILRTPANLQCQLWKAGDKEPSGPCWWWLRSAYCSVDALDATCDSGMYDYFDGFKYDGGAVRPALWVNFKQVFLPQRLNLRGVLRALLG